jgi:NAD(P)-dependent dehydrogenase (short-subunit alcohol dehydrogenase family)
MANSKVEYTMGNAEAESLRRERFDYFVNNAGNSQHINFDKMPEADFDAVVNVHLKGVPGPVRNM